MFFQPTPEQLQEKLVSGKAWEEFCDVLKAAGEIVLDDDNPSDPQTRAEGFRYLTRLIRGGLEAFVEYADPKAPVLRRMVHETVKMGSDNPDNHYLNAAISGQHTYRLHGHRGSAHWLEFATQKGSYGESRGLPPTGHLDAGDMHIEPDGSFELIISCDDPGDGRNWLPMEPDSGMLIVRQSVLDRSTEQLADLHLERIGGDGLPSPIDPAELAKGLQKASTLVAGAASIFVEWVDDMQAHVNQLPRFDQATSDAMGGVPHITYHHSYWRLGDGEALVITAMPPACDHWNFQLDNHWMESLDYRYFRIHINSKTAVTEPDGSIRIIVAHEDPGHPNWIQTVGHHFGAMSFRWVRSEDPDPVEPTCEVVPFASLVQQSA